MAEKHALVWTTDQKTPSKTHIVRVDSFLAGFKAHQELVKNKLLSTRLYSNENHLEWIYNRMIEVHKENPNYDYMIAFKKIIQSLLPKTEWDIEIDEQGKISLAT